MSAGDKEAPGQEPQAGGMDHVELILVPFRQWRTGCRCGFQPPRRRPFRSGQGRGTGRDHLRDDPAGRGRADRRDSRDHDNVAGQAPRQRRDPERELIARRPSKVARLRQSRFTVNDDLDEEYRVGLFAQPGKTYDAWIRSRNADALRRDDLKRTRTACGKMEPGHGCQGARRRR